MTIRDPGGLYSYLATPYDTAGRVDTEILEEYVRRIIAAGVAGVTCIASTCEGPYLTDEERTAVLRTVCRTASGKAAINVGIGAVSTHQATIHARQAEDLGATSLMVASAVSGVPYPAIAARIWPLFLGLMAAATIIAFVPWLSLWFR